MLHANVIINTPIIAIPGLDLKYLNNLRPPSYFDQIGVNLHAKQPFRIIENQSKSRLGLEVVHCIVYVAFRYNKTPNNNLNYILNKKGYLS